MKGGSANNYDYVYQDPINSFDLDGRMCFIHCHWRHIIGHTISGIGTAVNWGSTVIPAGPLSFYGGSIGTIWQVAGERIYMDHYNRHRDGHMLLNQLGFGLMTDGLSSVLGHYGSRVFIHAVNSVNNLPTRPASMHRWTHARRMGWEY